MDEFIPNKKIIGQKIWDSNKNFFTIKKINMKEKTILVDGVDSRTTITWNAFPLWIEKIMR